MKKIIFRFLHNLQFSRLMRYLTRKKIIILMYHGFTSKEHVGVENYLGYHIHIDVFRKQLDYLKRYRNIISLQQLVRYYKQNVDIPANSVVITIDDGYKSNYHLSYPILKEFRVPATIFLTTDFIENKNFLWVDRLEYAINTTKLDKLEIDIDNNKLIFYLNDKRKKIECIEDIKSRLRSSWQESIEETISGIEKYLNSKLRDSKRIPAIYMPLEWNEIIEMVRSGIISIGSHTHTHAILTKCHNNQIREEIMISKQLIEDRIGVKCNFFCYPNGQIRDFNQYTRKMLQEAGYTCALTSVSGMNDSNIDVYELHRYYTSRSRDLVEFIMILCGVSSYLAKFKKFILRMINRSCLSLLFNFFDGIYKGKANL